MGLLDTMKGMLAQYTAGTASENNAEADFHQLAQSLDSGTLAQGISAVMRSDQTPPFAQIVSQLFASGSGDQRTAMLKTLLSSAAPDLQTSLAAMLAGASAPVGPPSGAQAAPSPDTVAAVARRVEQSNPGVVDTMSSFYAQHPALVKTLGSAALMIAMRKIADTHRVPEAKGV
jgi:hypothetical protein